MSVTSVIIKSANFAIASSNTTIVQDLGNHEFSIPVISATLAEVQAAFGNCSGTVMSNAGVLGTGYAAFLATIGFEYCQFPSLLFYKSDALDVTNPKASFFKALQPDTEVLNNSTYTSPSALFINHDSTGFMLMSGTGDGFVYNAQGQVYSPQTSAVRFVGVFRSGGEAGIGYMAITSDNYMVIGRLWQNNRNSNLSYWSQSRTTVIRNWLDAAPDPPPPAPTDPYAPGGISSPGGGDGTFDFSSTDIPIPALPTIGAYNTGFISLYRPSATELHSLASYMWSSAFDINNFIKIFANPGECILGLHIIPTSGTHPEGAGATLMVGNISTGLSMTRLTEQYYECDCGTITISPKWGAYLDYSPYSKLSLYLPYIGFVPISPDDCMGGTIRVVYHVDVLSGSCCAYVYCTSNRGVDGHTLYTFTGSCACVCPVTEGQYTNGIIGSIRGGVGLAAGLLTGNVLGGLEDAANALISMAKPDVSRSGSFGGSAGLMGIQYPYLVLTVPKMATPDEQNKYIGYPSFITTELSDVTGYASIKITHMEGMAATDEEITELVGILEEGVIM